jgi:hypothetical protein
MNNGFVLKMCSGANWHFTTKKNLYSWARAERDAQWNAMLTFADAEDLVEELKYFKDQCLAVWLTDLNKTYKDIVVILKDKEFAQHRRKHARVNSFSEEYKSLASWSQEAVKKIDLKVEAVKGKMGRKEEEFWGKLKKKAEQINSKVIEMSEDAKHLKDIFDHEFGTSCTAAEKKAIHKKTKKFKEEYEEKSCAS